MGENEPVSQRECDKMHKTLDTRLSAIETSQRDNFKEIFNKLDAVVGLNGKIEFSNIKIEGIGRKLDSHVKEHGDFIKWTLLIISLISVLVTVISVLIKK